MTIIDLFSGAGGMSLGFERAGFDISLGVEQSDSAIQTYRENFKHKAKQADIQSLDAKDLPDASGIIGGPPCQDFSRDNSKRGGEKTKLIFEFARIVCTKSPDFFVMENVPGILDFETRFNRFKQKMRLAGYQISVIELNAKNYGVPQNRKRVFTIGASNIPLLSLPVDKKRTTVGDVLMDLPQLSAGESSNEYYNHTAPDHSNKVIKRIENTKPGESIYDSWGSKKRLDESEISPTLKAGKRANFHHAHPVDNRGLTIRERARIQTFPDSFKFYGPITEQRRITGNAVPVKLSHTVADIVKQIVA